MTSNDKDNNQEKQNKYEAQRVENIKKRMSKFNEAGKEKNILEVINDLSSKFEDAKYADAQNQLIEHAKNVVGKVTIIFTDEEKEIIANMSNNTEDNEEDDKDDDGQKSKTKK